MRFRVIGLAAIGVAALLLFPCASAYSQSFNCSIDDQTVYYDPATGEGAFTADVVIAEDDSDPEYPTDICGVVLVIENDPTYVEAVNAVTAGDVAALNGGSGPEFFYYEIWTDGVDANITMDIFFSSDFTTTLVLDGPVASIDYELTGDPVLEYEYANTEGIDLSTELEFQDDVDPTDPLAARANMIMSVEAGPSGFVELVVHEAVFDNALITILPDNVDPPPPPPPPAIVFLRGDVDGNGTVSVLSDAIFLLRWGFSGGTEPPCMDAADINNNDTASPLTDSLALLNYGFAAGDPPADPGPETCGEDPGADAAVDCETPPGGCD